MTHQLLALTALWYGHLDLTLALGGERIGEQRALFEIVRHQNIARRRLVIVELCKERAQHFSRSQCTIGFREIGAIAPILSSAEEKYFDTGITAGMMHGDHVGFLEAARIDSLMRLDRRKPRKAVAVGRCALQIEPLRSFF